MSINQYIEEQLAQYARRVLEQAGERAAEALRVAGAYHRAYQMTREFRRLGG